VVKSVHDRARRPFCWEGAADLLRPQRATRSSRDLALAPAPPAISAPQAALPKVVRRTSPASVRVHDDFIHVVRARSHAPTSPHGAAAPTCGPRRAVAGRAQVPVVRGSGGGPMSKKTPAPRREARARADRPSRALLSGRSGELWQRLSDVLSELHTGRSWRRRMRWELRSLRQLLDVQRRIRRVYAGRQRPTAASAEAERAVAARAADASHRCLPGKRLRRRRLQRHALRRLLQRLSCRWNGFVCN
jgi:hypothetical protein